MRKPKLRLRFHWFDGKTPLWWVERHLRMSDRWISTGGYVSSANAIAEAARL